MIPGFVGQSAPVSLSINQLAKETSLILRKGSQNVTKTLDISTSLGSDCALVLFSGDESSFAEAIEVGHRLSSPTHLRP